MLDAALTLFATHGYSETSVDELVREAGVTKGAFYYYFKSKDEVLELLHNQFLDYELDIARKVSHSEGTPTEKLHDLVGNLIRSIVQHRLTVVVFFQEIDRLPSERRLEIERRRRVYQQEFEDVIREGIAKGCFHADLDPVIATLGIFGLCNYTYRWLNPKGRVSVDEVIRMFTNMVLRSVSIAPVKQPERA